jgi:hypothetical protein
VTGRRSDRPRGIRARLVVAKRAGRTRALEGVRTRRSKSVPTTKLGCPISRSFFARCGILRLPIFIIQPSRGCQSRSVASHISRKTSEMWGTPRYAARWNFDRRVLTLNQLLRSAYLCASGTGATAALQCSFASQDRTPKKTLSFEIGTVTVCFAPSTRSW